MPSADPETSALKPRGTRRSVGRRVLRVAVGIVIALAAVAVVLVVKPVTPPSVIAGADPTMTYGDAIARFEAVLDDEDTRGDVIPVCNSQLLTHEAPTARSFVLFHGYLSCPAQFAQVAQALYAAGHNVYIPLAPQHGEQDRQHTTLDQLSTEELIAYGMESVDIATGLGDSVTVVGLSGGGAVAAYVAQFRADVDLVVPIAPFLGLAQAPAPLTAGLINLADVLPPINWGFTEADVNFVPYESLQSSTRAAAAYMRLGHLVLADAAASAHRAERTLTVLNEADDTVNNDVIDELTGRWRDDSDAGTSEYRFPASLQLPHDLIGPDGIHERTATVYPILLELLGAA